MGPSREATTGIAMCSVLESLGFKQSYSDAAIYVMSKGDLC